MQQDLNDMALVKEGKVQLLYISPEATKLPVEGDTVVSTIARKPCLDHIKKMLSRPYQENLVSTISRKPCLDHIKKMLS